jgi:hypothetical protein
MNNAISIFDFPDLSEEACARLEAMREIDRAKAKTAAAKRLSRPEVEGWSWQNLHKLWQRWVAAGRNEIILLDRRYHSELQKQKPQTLPNEFLDWAQSIILSNQRKKKPAYRKIITQWQDWLRTGESIYRIPGYDTPPRDCGKGYPAGWSYKNLAGHRAPANVEILIARQGTVAAKIELPYIPSTREGTRFLEYVFCDDVWHDRKVLVPGYVEPCRILQLGCLDLATGVYLGFGMRPDLPREDGTRERLKRRDFLFLVSSILMEYGWPLDYTMRFIVERATATFSKAEARTLYDLSNGQIQVGYTSMEGQFVLAWDESKSGNPQGKGPLESWHNLFHNELAFAAGQVGKDRDHTPAALYGSDREAIALQKLAMISDPATRAKIIKPYPELMQAHQETRQIVQRINSRRDHALEGFDKTLQWTIPSLGMDWKSEAEFDALEPALQELVQWRPVCESPNERLAKLSAGLHVAKPHPGAMVRFYEDSHTATKIQRFQANIKLEGRSYWFGPESPIDAQPNGTEIILHHAPLDPDYALVTSHGKFIGVWKRQLVRRGDADELAEGIRRKQTFLNHAASTVRGKMLDKLAEQDRRLQDNIDALTDGEVLPSAAGFSRAKTLQSPRSDVAQAMQTATETLRHQSDSANAEKQRDHETKSRIRDLDDDILDTLTSSQQAAEEDDDTDQVCAAIDALL